MNQSTSEAADARSREQREADTRGAREQAARAQFLGQFEPESPDVTAQERGLKKDAQDLSPVAVRNALMFAGCDPSEGLGGVPPSRAYAVSALLRSAYRVNLST